MKKVIFSLALLLSSAAFASDASTSGGSAAGCGGCDKPAPKCVLLNPCDVYKNHKLLVHAAVISTAVELAPRFNVPFQDELVRGAGHAVDSFTKTTGSSKDKLTNAGVGFVSGAAGEYISSLAPVKDIAGRAVRFVGLNPDNRLVRHATAELLAMGVNHTLDTVVNKVR